MGPNVQALSSDDDEETPVGAIVGAIVGVVALVGIIAMVMHFQNGSAKSTAATRAPVVTVESTTDKSAFSSAITATSAASASRTSLT